MRKLGNITFALAKKHTRELTNPGRVAFPAFCNIHVLQSCIKYVFSKSACNTSFHLCTSIVMPIFRQEQRGFQIKMTILFLMGVDTETLASTNDWNC